MRADDPTSPRPHLTVVRGDAPRARTVATGNRLLRDHLLYPRPTPLPSQRWANLSAGRVQPAGVLMELLVDRVEQGAPPDALCDLVIDAVNSLRPVLRAHADAIWRPAA